MTVKAEPAAIYPPCPLPVDGYAGAATGTTGRSGGRFEVSPALAAIMPAEFMEVSVKA